VTGRSNQVAGCVVAAVLGPVIAGGLGAPVWAQWLIAGVFVCAGVFTLLAYTELD
jgi:hypothetical protein